MKWTAGAINGWCHRAVSALYERPAQEQRVIGIDWRHDGEQTDTVRLWLHKSYGSLCVGEPQEFRGPWPLTPAQTKVMQRIARTLRRMLVADGVWGAKT